MTHKEGVTRFPRGRGLWGHGRDAAHDGHQKSSASPKLGDPSVFKLKGATAKLTQRSRHGRNFLSRLFWGRIMLVFPIWFWCMADSVLYPTFPWMKPHRLCSLFFACHSTNTMEHLKIHLSCWSHTVLRTHLYLNYTRTSLAYHLFKF